MSSVHEGKVPVQRQQYIADNYETIVVGAGQAGLAMSYFLTQHGRSHIVLEQGDIGECWRNQRWDSFHIVTPNSISSLPDFPHLDKSPDAYMTRDEYVDYLDAYAASFNAPIRSGVCVTALKPAADAPHQFLVETTRGNFTATNVVVATGILQNPRIPQNLSEQIPEDIQQYHTSHYRNSAQLPEGSVLVVGTGQSGCQVAEDLYLSGRKVYLSVGRTGRVPRRYRGQDVYYWVAKGKILTSTHDRFSSHAHVTGRDGGHDLNLYQFARDGMTLLGRLISIDGTQIELAPDLLENLAYADWFEEQYKIAVDDFIQREEIEAPADLSPAACSNHYEGEIIRQLDLDIENITSIIWATGYTYDFQWIDLPVFDDAGFPIQTRGISDIPGLYFLGMNWRTDPKSAFIGSVGREAEHIANHIVELPIQ